MGVGVLPGRRIGRYKLLFPIGAGGMAQVWAARPDSAGLARTVAIKLVLPDYGADPEYERMFVDEAMVARAHDRVIESNDPTAHAVIVALREAARKLGLERLADATIFTTIEPCVMCVGALLESDVAALVYALPHPTEGAAGTVIQLGQHPDLQRRIQIVSGIRRDEAMELLAGTTAIA